MATFHEIDDDGRTVVRCFVKGAPDVLLARSTTYLDADGVDRRRSTTAAERVLAENDRLAGEGMRVLAVARRDFDPATFDPNGDLLALVDDLAAPGADRHRRPAPQGGEGRDRAVQATPASACG